MLFPLTVSAFARMCLLSRLPTSRVKALPNFLARYTRCRFVLPTKRKGWEEQGCLSVCYFTQVLVLILLFIIAYARSHTGSSAYDCLLCIASRVCCARYRLAWPPLADPDARSNAVPPAPVFPFYTTTPIAPTENDPNHNSLVFLLPSGNAPEASVFAAPSNGLPMSLSVTPTPGPTRCLPSFPFPSLPSFFPWEHVIYHSGASPDPHRRHS